MPEGQEGEAVELDIVIVSFVEPPLTNPLLLLPAYVTLIVLPLEKLHIPAYSELGMLVENVKPLNVIVPCGPLQPLLESVITDKVLLFKTEKAQIVPLTFVEKVALLNVTILPLFS